MSPIRSAPSEQRGDAAEGLKRCLAITWPPAGGPIAQDITCASSGCSEDGRTLSPQPGHQRSSKEGFISTNVTSEGARAEVQSSDFSRQRSTRRQTRPRHHHHHGNDRAVRTVASISGRCSSLPVISPSIQRFTSSPRPRLLLLFESTSFQGGLNTRGRPFPAHERQLHFLFVPLTQDGVFMNVTSGEGSIASRIPV